MNYRYTYKTTAFDLWQLSMYYIYGSLTGVCNVIFTAAILILTVTRWEQSQTFVRCLLSLGCCLFPVLQPVLVYRRARKQAAGITEETKINLNEDGLHIRVGDQTSRMPWSAVKKISKKPSMIIIFCDTTHGFVFTNRVLGKEKEKFYRDIALKVK